MAKQKLDFHLSDLSDDQTILRGVKTGECVVLRPESESSTSLKGFNKDGAILGSVPVEVSRRLPPNIHAQASVRSIKKDATGQVQQILLRVEFTEAGPTVAGELACTHHPKWPMHGQAPCMHMHATCAPLAHRLQHDEHRMNVYSSQPSCYMT